MKFVDPNEEIEIKEEQKNEIEIEYWPIKDLPSRFNFYPKGTEIFGRPLNVIEVKKLGLLNEGNSDFVITQILKNSIKGIEIENLYQADKLYILLWLRAQTFLEAGYSVDFTCEKCQQESTYDFKLDNLDIKYFDEEFFKNNEIILKNGDKIVLGYLRVSDEMKQEKFREEFAKMEINEDVLELATAIQTINGEKIPLINKYTYLTNPKKLSASEYIKIESIKKKYDFGVRPVLKVICNSCGGSAQAGVTFRKSFLLPEYRVPEIVGN